MKGQLLYKKNECFCVSSILKKKQPIKFYKSDLELCQRGKASSRHGTNVKDLQTKQNLYCVNALLSTQHFTRYKQGKIYQNLP